MESVGALIFFLFVIILPFWGPAIILIFGVMSFYNIKNFTEANVIGQAVGYVLLMTAAFAICGIMRGLLNKLVGDKKKSRGYLVYILITTGIMLIAISVKAYNVRREYSDERQSYYDKGIQYINDNKYINAENTLANLYNKEYKDADTLYLYCFAKTHAEINVKNAELAMKCMNDISDDYNGEFAEEILEYKAYILDGSFYEKMVSDSQIREEEERKLAEARGKAAKRKFPYIGMSEDLIEYTQKGKANSVQKSKTGDGKIETVYTWNSANAETQVVIARVVDGVVERVDYLTPTPTPKPSNSLNHSSNNNQNWKYTDPDDYDNPDDYADDAWGMDFDDWDDAYDYWENY